MTKLKIALLANLTIKYIGIQTSFFQSQYCENLAQEGLECPTKDDFNRFDQDKNGVLIWYEWVSHQE